MIRKLFSVTIIALSLSVAAFPKDKEKESLSPKPELTDAQKLTLREFDFKIAQIVIKTQPDQVRISILGEQREAEFQKAITGIDQTKWQVNRVTFEVTAVPPKPEEKKPEATPEPK